nr:virion structural protein [Microvirus sp.]
MHRTCKCGSCGLVFSQPTKCQQHLSKMCDVNNMIARAIAGDTSVIRRGTYFDVSQMPDDMQEVLNIGNRAREAFEALPADLRVVYPSPDVFLAALGNPEERKRLEKFGIINPPEPPPAPVAVKVIPEGNEDPKSEAHS